jgi:dienelactone hydrolase
MKKYIFFLPILWISCTGSKDETTTSDEPDIVTEEITYTSDTVEMKGFLAYDANQKEKRPGILVVHEWWGQTDYPKERAKMLAQLGYTAMAVDMYGGGQIAEHPQDAGVFSGHVMSDIDGATGRFMAALEVLKQHTSVDTERLGAIGYCFGGTVVLTMGRIINELDGVAAFHAGLGIPVPPTSEMNTVFLICNGADDSFVSSESIAKFKMQMDSVGADYRYIDFAGAVHGFTNPGADEYGQKFEIPLAYNSQADLESWEDMKNFFDRLFNENQE